MSVRRVGIDTRRPKKQKNSCIFTSREASLRVFAKTLTHGTPPPLADAHSPRRNRFAEQKTSFFEVQTHVPHQNQHPPSKNPANKHTKKPPAGRNLFHLAPPALASLAPAGLRSIFGRKKGDFLIFCHAGACSIHSEPAPRRENFKICPADACSIHSEPTPRRRNLNFPPPTHIPRVETGSPTKKP